MNQKYQVLLMLLLFWSIGHSHAGQNRFSFPESMVPLGQPKLCQSSYNGSSQQYSCQDYQANEQTYRIIYLGGLVPKAILYLDAQNKEHLEWSPTFGDQNLVWSLPVPKGVPTEAVHYGTGVCQDEYGKKIPCSVYEHRVARKAEYHRYMVFYAPDGSGPTHVDEQVAGENKNAMLAEIAYQIGLSLLDTDCCSEQAMAYLELAYSLFPNAMVYQKAYEHAKSVLAAGENLADAN